MRTYFENLLPDSDVIRQRIARRFRTNSTDAEIARLLSGVVTQEPMGPS